MTNNTSGDDRTEMPLLPTRDQRLELLVIGLLLLLPLLPTLGSLRYATDDYYLRSSVDFSSADLGYNFASSGRPGQALLADLFFNLGASPPSGSIFTALHIAASAYVSWLLCGLWQVQNTFHRVLVAVLHGAHPFYVELYTYSLIPLFTASALTLGFLALAVCPTSLSRSAVPRLLFAVLLFAGSLSIYQLFFAHLAVAALVAAALGALRQDGHSRTALSGALRTGLLIRAGAMASALALYVLLNFIYQRASAADSLPQGKLMSLDDLGQRLSTLRDLLRHYLLGDHALQRGPWLRALLLTLVSVTILAAVAQAVRRRPKAEALFGALIVAICLSLAIVLLPGISMASEFFVASPRIFSAAAVALAGFLAISLAAGGRIASFTRCLATVLVVAYLTIQGNATIDQQRLNLQDQLTASQILSRLHAFPKFNVNTPIAIIGDRWNFRRLGVDSALGGLNVSALTVPWAKLHVLREISGYPLQQTSEAQTKRAIELATTMPTWPDHGSVRLVDGFAVVKISTSVAAP